MIAFSLRSQHRGLLPMPKNLGKGQPFFLCICHMVEASSSNMHLIKTSHCGTQALAQLKHQLNFRAPASKQTKQQWMQDLTTSSDKSSKGGLVHLTAEYGPLAMRSHTHQTKI